MRGAIIAVSKEGATLANRIKNFIDFDIYIKEKYSDFAQINFKFYNKIFELIKQIFNAYDALVFISATGIAVRSIAPYIKSKLSDPAVLVIDEKGKYVVSLLSGHVGGANILSKEIANFIEGTPVITTATDVNELAAPDLVAHFLNLNPYPKSEILNINTSLLKGENVCYFVDENLKNAEFYKEELSKFNIHSTIINSANFDKKNHTVLITKKTGNLNNVLYLIPQKLVAGIGCRKGATKEEILSALTDATKIIGRNLSDIDLITSTIVKRNERGILEVSEELNIETKFFSNEKLQKKIDEYFLNESDFVKKIIGVGNVAEASALSAVKCGRFALNKTKYEKVTVALVWEKSLWSE